MYVYSQMAAPRTCINYCSTCKFELTVEAHKDSITWPHDIGEADGV